ncbi:3526_t:CDS:2 [Gigaspora margarita]|uniref:3526_t:CDS:1 n=1 Tax=Gigaspora margarita TaxID=4874 RepID=A0ABN7V9M6_GIGMA|nr:3526_t:CDS:2 [Gigaspora margarita]
MSSYGGKPSHYFNKFVHIKKDVKIKQSWTWAEAEVRKINMSNTVPSISKHLSVCKNFQIIYPNKVEYVKENIGAKKQRTAKLRIANYLKRQLNQMPKLDDKDNNISQAFQWIKNQKTIEFFNFISPLLELPSRKTLANEILKNSAESIQNNIEVAAKEDKYKVLIWGAKDISGDCGNTNATIKHISAFLNETQSKNIKINTVITNSASSYNAARNDLSDITVVYKEEENNSNKLIASKIILIIDDPDFWINLVGLEKILYPYSQIHGELQKEKFIKIKNNRVAVPVGDEEIDNIVLEPPELDVNNIDDESDNEDNENIDDFIKL